MDIPAALITAFPPDAERLLNRVRRKVDDAMLMDIASADYGYIANEMFGVLRRIRDTGSIPDSPNWQLIEVLRLTRWCNPDAPDAPPFKLGPSGVRGHLTRLFACAVLLRTLHEDDSSDSTLAQSLASAKLLGDEMSNAAARFLTWQIPRLGHDSQRLLFVVGLLVLAMRLRSGRLNEQTLGTVAEWVLVEESHYCRSFPQDSTNPMPIAFSLLSGFWRPLATELTREAEAICAEDVRTNLQLCNMLLETSWGH